MPPQSAAMDRELSTLDMPPSMRDQLLKGGFLSTSDVLSMKPFALAKELDVSLQEASSMIQAVMVAVSGEQSGEGTDEDSAAERSKQQPVSALELCQKSGSQRPVITFCKTLDKMLGSGVQVGQVTEFCGVPGIGKTQLGMQLALDVQIPEVFTGNGGESVYIDTEGSFMVERVHEMAQALSDHVNRIANRAVRSAKPGVDTSRYVSTAAELTPDRLLNNIHVFRVHNQTEQISVINALGAYLQAHPKVKIVVIDSIAFHFRQELQELSSRSRILCSIAQTLNQLAYDHNIAVVTINHITTRVAAGGTTRILPALGEQWSHCITNRVMMFWQDNNVRTACLIKSPSRPQGIAQFCVNQLGIRDASAAGSSASSSSATAAAAEGGSGNAGTSASAAASIPPAPAAATESEDANDSDGPAAKRTRL